MAAASGWSERRHPGAGAEGEFDWGTVMVSSASRLAVQSCYIPPPNWFSLHVVAAAATLTGGATDMLRRGRVGAVRGENMQFALTEDQRAIAIWRDFAEEMAPHAAAWDAEEIFPSICCGAPPDLAWRRFIGAEHGGSGLGRKEAALIFEELSAGWCRPPLICRSIRSLG